MNQEIVNTLILSSAFLCLFASAEVLYHFFKVKAEITRKIVHTFTGVITLLFPLMLGNHWLVLLLCASFAGILIFSIKFNFLKSINAVDRETVGSILYPLAIYLCYIYFDFKNQNYLFFYLPVLTLAICDPIAALIGKKWQLGKFYIGKNHKTLIGSAGFFLSSVMLTYMLFFLFLPQVNNIIIIATSIALIATGSEAISTRGYDNITIPLAVVFGLFIFQI